jgi:hypothetical protein
MSLDLTDRHRYNPKPHYRRYLHPRTNAVVIACLRDFDYPHYEADRFLDRRAFPTKDQALSAPLDLRDLLEATEVEDPEVWLLVRRNVQLLLRGAPSLGLEVRINDAPIAGVLLIGQAGA